MSEGKSSVMELQTRDPKDFWKILEAILRRDSMPITLVFELVTSRTKTVNVCCFKPSSLWNLAVAALELNRYFWIAVC